MDADAILLTPYFPTQLDPKLDNTLPEFAKRARPTCLAVPVQQPEVSGPSLAYRGDRIKRLRIDTSIFVLYLFRIRGDRSHGPFARRHLLRSDNTQLTELQARSALLIFLSGTMPTQGPFP